MKNLLTRPLFQAALLATSVGGMLAWSGQHNTLEASSHREAPLIADDPTADNTDLYAFRSPDDPTKVTIIANYIPFELPQGGPNYNTFGENIRYEIHVKNTVDLANPANPVNTRDDVTYRFTFQRVNQDLTTFFNIRLGQQNLKTTYVMEQSIAGGAFTTLISNGTVPPPNVGPRSIESGAGLNAGPNGYNTLMNNAIVNVGSMRVFCGPTDDPFFADLGGIFDLGGIRAPGAARDGLARKNCHAIALQIPIAMLSKNGQPVSAATNILDSNYIIGVWASASRPALRTLNATPPTSGPFVGQTFSGNYVQVSRIGMPLTNEVIQPIGLKDEWNAGTPYGMVPKFDAGAKNPELGLYMADNVPTGITAPKPANQTYYGEAVPGLGPLRIQSKSLAGAPGLPASGFDFRNGAAGLSGLLGNPLTANTALAPAAQGGFGEYLLNNGVAGMPRSVDLLPIFHTGVPNLPPYQLATGKTPLVANGAVNPLSAGKPFINNFLPTFGDMLRLNMAVPVTPRNSPDFSSEGLLATALIVFNPTNNPAYAQFNNATLQSVPNMDGFPNGRRLEDDVTRIELQAAGGVVLAAIGLWYDDYNAAASPAPSPVTAQLGRVLGFNAGITANDTTFKVGFPFSQTPWSGTKAQRVALAQRGSNLGMSPNLTVAQAYPNPFSDRTTLRFELPAKANMSVVISDITGRKVATVAKDKSFASGVNEVTWQPGREVAPGQYIATLYNGNTVVQSVRVERH